MKIAIQGIKGSFHHIVAELFFGAKVMFEECLNFEMIPQCIKQNRVDAGIMAIENTIAGAILPNYALIDKYNLNIIGEYYLHIDHHLMALKGQKMQDIKQVHSHPMALLQCRDFLEKYPYIHLMEDKDTAYVARKISEKKLKNIGAIAPCLAANIYNLDVLASGIQTIKQNFTRFFVVSNKANEVQNTTKASLKFTLKHQVGSLGNVLNIFARYNVNLSKIQSLPVIEEPWKYAFFTDLVFENHSDYQNALEDLKKQVSLCKVLGVYQNNNTYS